MMNCNRFYVTSQQQTITRNKLKNDNNNWDRETRTQSNRSVSYSERKFCFVLNFQMCGVILIFFLNVGDGTPRALDVALSHSFHSQWLSPSIDDEIIFFLLVNPKMNFSSCFTSFFFLKEQQESFLIFQSVNQRLWSIRSQMAVNWLDFSLGFPNNLCPLQHHSPEALHINIILKLCMNYNTQWQDLFALLHIVIQQVN